MRRMLDPKEAGGSTAKLYQHTINLYSNKYGSFYMTLYNYSNAAIDSAEKLNPVIGNIDKIAATGYITYNKILFNVYVVSYSSYNKKASVSGYCIDTASGNLQTVNLDIDQLSSFTDNVNEVR